MLSALKHNESEPVEESASERPKRRSRVLDNLVLSKESRSVENKMTLSTLPVLSQSIKPKNKSR